MSWKYAAAVQDNGPNYYAITTGGWGAPAIAHCWDEDTAERIVRAVNNYDELRRVAQEALDWIRTQSCDKVYMHPYPLEALQIEINEGDMI